jgi:hypothetical protein
VKMASGGQDQPPQPLRISPKRPSERRLEKRRTRKRDFFRSLYRLHGSLTWDC